MIKQIKKKLLAFTLFVSVFFFGLPPTYNKAKVVFAAELSDVVENKSIITEPQIIEETEEVSEEFIKGWTNLKVEVKLTPEDDATILTTFDFNTPIEYIEYDDGWIQIEYEEIVAYIEKDYISNEECLYREYELPQHRDFKSYMGYTALTNKKSRQYILQHDYAYTGDYGIRMVDGRYCLAIGSHFGTVIGQYFDLVLENGEVIPCIMGDQKADIHTDKLNIFTKNGCCSEFIVDTTRLVKTAKQMGNISSIKEEWASPVVKIIVYEKYILD